MPGRVGYHGVVGTDGGILKDRGGACVHVKSNEYDVCETAFSVVADMIIKILKGTI